MCMMIHIKLKTNPDTYYGVGINHQDKLDLVQLGDTLDQVRVCFTKKELEQLINKLIKIKEKISTGS